MVLALGFFVGLDLVAAGAMGLLAARELCIATLSQRMAGRAIRLGWFRVLGSKSSSLQKDGSAGRLADWTGWTLVHPQKAPSEAKAGGDSLQLS